MADVLPTRPVGGVLTQGVGRVPDGTGLSSPTEPQSSQGLGPSGFDPSRYEDVLRSLAAYVGAGGYNAPTVDPDVFERKITWGIDHLRDHIINTPETADFMAAVPLEATHQRGRWGSTHDAGKTPFDWFWLIGYLAQKAASSAVAGDLEKAKHHTISTAAALANWHAALSGKDTKMRPGIEPPSDSDGSPKGRDAKRLDGEAATARAEGIAQPTEKSERNP